METRKEKMQKENIDLLSDLEYELVTHSSQ